MNKTKIEWVRNPDGTQGYTLNPIVGCSRHCSYCYAEQQAKRQRQRCHLCYAFTPHFHEERLKDLLSWKKPIGVFLCSMGEFFDKYVPFMWQNKILEIVEKTPHTYYLLTKAIDVLAEWWIKKPTWLNQGPVFPKNVRLGISIDGTNQTVGYDTLVQTDAEVKFVSFEPLRGPVKPKLKGINWVIIGPTSTRKGYVQPQKEWVDTIIKEARANQCAIFLKNKLDYPERIQEFPEVRG